MKPNPLASLNHFTVPFSIVTTLCLSGRPCRGNRSALVRFRVQDLSVRWGGVPAHPSLISGVGSGVSRKLEHALDGLERAHAHRLVEVDLRLEVAQRQVELLERVAPHVGAEVAAAR